MNVCFFGGGFVRYGGIERVTALISSEIAETTSVTVHTLSMADDGKCTYPISAKIKQGYFFKEKCSMKRALCRGALKKVLRYIRENNIDILIACGVMYFPLACIAAKLTGIKSVCWEHTSPTSKNEIQLENIIRYIGAHMSDANVLISEAALKHYDENYRKNHNWLIHNPADPKLFSDAPKYDKDSHKLISVGRLTYQKNYPLLLEIANRVLQGHDDWQWDIYGDGKEYDLLSQAIAEKGLNGKVALRGTVSDLYDRYPNYSAIVMTSRWEGFPMVLIEAAAKGLPMISFDIKTGPNEIICDGVNGYLIPENEVEMMVEKICGFIEDPDRREAMSTHSRETAQRFRINNSIQAWMELFAHLNERNKG